MNWPLTLALLCWPVPWDREHFTDALGSIAACEKKVWGAAYTISNGGRSEPKVGHVAGVLSGLWERRADVRPRVGDTLLGFHSRLRNCDGMGEFMSAQLVADVKYVEPLRSAPDWMTFAASGPGSRRGLNRVLGRPVDAGWREEDWRRQLRRVHEYSDLDLHAQDFQNCLCEFDKYERVRLGEGKPKRRFVPHA